ncbi:Cellulose synthase-like protein H1 [Acorus calamus]|uniref:Cellulose synthase-like protein H1 n=1 Tax=Acorus calamus TaxID=4465 RepID=A0AAV9DGT2_ACOCL|nr:Cellulose synthase-like protein H1 [Acorus calamus]
MDATNTLPLHERFEHKRTLHKALDLLILLLLLSLLFYRLAFLRLRGPVWSIAFLCESWFTFIWLITVNTKWSPVTYKTFPDRLKNRLEEFPPVDMFVTTADASLEPPIVTVNTVLSLLAVDYPAEKLACYVSDDGCSSLTFFALVEGAKFAKLWVPFCKKYNVQVRAPFAHLAMEPDSSNKDYLNDWKAMKVILENRRGSSDGIPSLIYVAREKRPKYPHHYKAGAMNVLARVSAVMTNAPFMLNVDCDMFVNNAEVILHAMCLFLGFDDEVQSGYVQCPQHFYGALMDDPFGNQLVIMQQCLGYGFGGIQGPMYGGTGCFHQRKIIYGTPPPTNKQSNTTNMNALNGKELQRKFGYSSEMLESVSRTISGETEKNASCGGLLEVVEAAIRVADCSYESNTSWGEEMGWIYGSTTEDVLTGLRIQSMGWKSVYLTPDRSAFLGNAPQGGPASLKQLKRWATGVLEILLGKDSPLIAVATKRLMIRQCLAYLVILVWALRSVPEVLYSLLPPYCILTNSSFLPKVGEASMIIPVSLFVIYNIYTLAEYFTCGLSAHAWWNNMRMQRITSANAWLFGLLSVALKLMGLSDTVFEITRKDQSSSEDETDEDPGRFTFDDSSMFVPGTALVIVHGMGLIVGLLGLQRPGGDRGNGPGLGEFVCSFWVLLSFLPFVKGFFRRGKYGIPWPTIGKAAALGSLFLILCGWRRS